ncbi:MAG: alpha-L-fucosidase [Armatimonadota bacterium]
MSHHDQPRPTDRQLRWQDLELGMFCHFGPNTFCDREWGEGDEPPEVFAPTDLNPSQWAAAAAEAGMRYLVFTTKHHDGFCLWPTETTDYSVRSSRWRGGRGDVVADVAEATREEGLALGLYCSPWDRHEPTYDAEPAAYDELFAGQWRELLTRYGPVSVVWLDGAGSKGHQYTWELIIGTIREHAPEACIHALGAPDFRWVGNEDGLAPYPCWNVVHSPEEANQSPGLLFEGFRQSFPHYLPTEADARIRANWFWHPDDWHTLKSAERLVDMYECSVGRGTNLILNVAPDDRGLLPEPDVARLHEMAAEIERRYGRPVAGAAGPAEALTAELDRAQPVNAMVAMEDLRDGERVRQWRLLARIAGRWQGVAVGTALGHKHIARFATIVADAVKLEVTRSDGEPVLRRLEVFYC